MIHLSQLAAALKLPVVGEGDPVISGLTEDSREARPAMMFTAVKGLNADGRDYIGQALDLGSPAVLLEGDDYECPVPRLLAPKGRLRPVMAEAAAIIYDRPAEKMITIGVTGTNGKTTTSYLVESMLHKAGLTPGVLGTVNFRWPGAVKPAANTTPEGPALQAALAEMVAAGAKAAVMEISSHALALGRVAGLRFDFSLFTNLSHDHLDFHEDMENYFSAKEKLFTSHLKPGPSRAVINYDDPYGRKLAAKLGSQALTFGFDDGAQVRGSGLKLGRNGLSMTIESPEAAWEQTSPLLAEVNAYNLLATAALGLALKLPVKTICESLKGAASAPGRLERVGDNSDFLVLVDYAHSPDALAKALKGGRQLQPKRLLTVFGCGGDRDRAKRPVMGCLAGELADLTILTSDNPRTEDPEFILSAIETGLKERGLTKLNPQEVFPDSWKPGSYVMMSDRRKAIHKAISLMNPGDALIIAGKGHEDYQIIGRKKYPLDDRAEALATLKEMGRD